MDVLKRTLPRRLIRLRELLGLTQKGLAQRAGLTASTVNELESGMARDANLSTILAIAGLGATPDWLLGFDPAPAIVTEGLRHRVAEIVVELHDSGRTAARIAIEMGLHESSVQHILEAEYESRRLRRQV